MANKKIIVETKNGGANSLKRSIRIAFTNTPDEPDGPAHPYAPVTYFVNTFDVNIEKSFHVWWGSSFTLGFYTGNGRVFNCIGPTCSVPAGHTTTLTSTWSTPIPYNNGVAPQKSSLMIVNESGLAKEITLACYAWLVVYHPLENGRSIIVPSSWKLQAYIVDDGVPGLKYTTLQPEDLKHPIFPAPILWDALPDESTWILTEDNNGVIRIKNDKYSPVETATKPVVESAGDRVPLSEILERLTVIERSITRIQDDVTSGQRAIDDIRNKYGTKEEIQEARANIDQNQDRLSVVQKAVTEAQQLLSGMEKSTQNRISTLEETANRARDHVVAVEKAVHQTQDHVSLVQQMVLAKPIPAVAIPDPVSASNFQAANQGNWKPAVEARMEKLERAGQDQRKALRSMDRRMPAMDKLEADLAVMQASFSSLDRRVGAIEVKLREDGFGTGDSLSPSLEGSPVMFPTHSSGELPEN